MDNERDAWLAAVPPPVRAIAEQYPDDTCYRDAERLESHLAIGGYELTADGNMATVVVLHGHDSTIPGAAMLGFHPARLVVCGCGRWELPTEKQAAVAAAAARRLGLPHALGTLAVGPHRPPHRG